MDKIIKVPVCRCNNCDNLYIDPNPQVGAMHFHIRNNRYPRLNFDKDKGHICPQCLTSDYLSDDVTAGEVDLAIS